MEKQTKEGIMTTFFTQSESVLKFQVQVAEGELNLSRSVTAVITLLVISSSDCIP